MLAQMCLWIMDDTTAAGLLLPQLKEEQDEVSIYRVHREREKGKRTAMQYNGSLSSLHVSVRLNWSGGNQEQQFLLFGPILAYIFIITIAASRQREAAQLKTGISLFLFPSTFSGRSWIHIEKEERGGKTSGLFPSNCLENKFILFHCILYFVDRGWSYIYIEWDVMWSCILLSLPFSLLVSLSVSSLTCNVTCGWDGDYFAAAAVVVVVVLWEEEKI